MSIFSDIVSGLAGGAAAATPTGAVSSVANLANTVVSRIWEDPEARAKASLAIAELDQKGELEDLAIQAGLLQGQMDINKIEAASASLFVAGWRPAVGWLCAAGIGWAFVLAPVLEYAVSIFAPEHKALPSIDIENLLALLAGMLGLADMRRREKRDGTTR